MADTNDENPIPWLQLLHDLRGARGTEQVNAALLAIQDAARMDFIRSVAWKLSRLPRMGPDAVFVEAADILNDVLLKLWQGAKDFRGTTDQEAQAFVRVIFDRTRQDSTKTPLRRDSLWRELLCYLRGRAARQAGHSRATNDDDGSDEIAIDMAGE